MTIQPRHMVMFTANSVVKVNGELVMGAGNAKACKLAHPTSPKLFGELNRTNPDKRVYILKCGLGALASFQTKLDWKNPAPEWLLDESITVLQQLAEKYPAWTFHLPCPAINHGGMSADVVLPKLAVLPNNVLVYKAN